MSTSTLVIKSLPKHIHEQLKELARAHRRSLTQEVITILEQMLISPKKEEEILEEPLSFFARRKLVPGYLKAAKAFAGGTDSSIMISEDRDAR